MYSSVYRAVRGIWPGGRDIKAYLAEFSRTQWLSEDELRARQFQQIVQLVTYAYENVPYYRQRYQSEGFYPEDIRTLEDFQRLPCLERKDIAAHLDSLVSQEMRRELRPNKTGGSTGIPMHFYYENSLLRCTYALELRGRGWYGIEQGDKVAVIWGYLGNSSRSRATRVAAQIKDRMTRVRATDSFNWTEPAMQAYAGKLVRWQPTMIKAYADAMYLFGRFVRDRGIKGIRPRFIQTTSEKLMKPHRQLLEEVFGCPVAESYSSRELATIAFECPSGGLHVCEPHYLEIVSNGKPADAGTLGEVAVTSLNSRGMPLIRYKNGDMGVYDRDVCSCGRGLPVLREIVGRTCEIVLAPDGRLVDWDVPLQTLLMQPEVVVGQIHQKDLRHVTVKIVLDAPVDSTWFERVGAEIARDFGTGIEVDFEVVERIERSPSGKYRPVISDIEPSFGPCRPTEGEAEG